MMESQRKTRKISFLIPAHNEGKVINNTLKNLLSLPYKNYEVIIGLDGCTDNTENVVREFCKKSKKFRYYILNLRQGKPVVIDTIIKKASGEIIIINDADWIFNVKDEKSLRKFVSVFNNSEIGGIAESFPVEWNKEKIKRGNFGYKMVAYSSFFWLNFQKEKFTYRKNAKENWLYLKEPTMFLTNIFKKELYRKNFSLGDDFERTQDIMNKKYKIVLFDDENMPRMTAIYDKISVKNLFVQKIRTSIAREQLGGKQKINVKNYYAPAIFYIFRNSWKRGIGIGAITSFWIAVTILATLISKFKKKDTREGWKLRAR